MNTDYLLTDINNFYNLIGYILSGIFISVGLFLIVQNKSHKKFLQEEKNKNNDINKSNNNKQIKIFNPDSIFKILPTFSNKNFFNKIEIDMKNKLELDNIKVIKKEIIDFKEENDKYIITSLFKIKNKNSEQTITIISETNKHNNTIINCPTCGGKIKDSNLLRCKHCDSVINTKNINQNNWKITKIK